MKEEFMKRIDARKKIESYPFGAEEMLLHREFKDLNKSKNEIDLENYPFGAEEMLLNAELKKLDLESR